MSGRSTVRSVIALWVVAPLLLALSLYRPFTPSSGRAKALPPSVPGYPEMEEHEMTQRHFELLGTTDAVWRTYRDPDGGEVYVVALFHEENWKSVHPPRLCIEGSDMAIHEEKDVEVTLNGVEASVGSIVAHSRSADRDYVSLYVYGAEGLLTGSYSGFFAHHAPLALFRRPTRGFLLRVETFVGEGGVEMARARCLDFLGKILPAAQALLEE
jgi:EpsI family protein